MHIFFKALEHHSFLTTSSAAAIEIAVVCVALKSIRTEKFLEATAESYEKVRYQLQLITKSKDRLKNIPYLLLPDFVTRMEGM